MRLHYSMLTSFSIRQGYSCYSLYAGLVVDGAIRVEEPTVAMRGVGAQAHVTHDQQAGE